MEACQCTPCGDGTRTRVDRLMRPSWNHLQSTPRYIATDLKTKLVQTPISGNSPSCFVLLAGSEGLEPPTYGLTVRRSTNWTTSQYLRDANCHSWWPHRPKITSSIIFFLEFVYCKLLCASLYIFQGTYSINRIMYLNIAVRAFGLSEEPRTPGLVIPNHALYRLSYTQICS